MINLAVLNRAEKRIADIDAWDVMRDRQLRGHDILTFETKYHGLEKGYRIAVKMPDLRWQEYIIDQMEETRAGVSVTAQHSIYELAGDFIESGQPERDCDYALSQALVNTRWTRYKPSGVADYAVVSLYRISVREAIQRICDAYDIELNYFVELSGTGIAARNIYFEKRIGDQTGRRRFEAGHDMDGVTRTVEMDSVITALYGFGRGELIYDDDGNPTGGFGRRVNFASINNGKMYVEDIAARDNYGRLNANGTAREHIFGRIEYDDTEDPAEIKSRTEAELACRCEPRISYKGRLFDLAKAGFTHEGVDIGDKVVLIDDEIGIETVARVQRFVRSLDDSKQSVIEIGNYEDTLTSHQRAEHQLIRDIRDQLATDPTGGGLEQITLSQVQGMLDRWREQMNSGLAAGSLETVPGGFIFESETGATMIGPDGFMTANTKDGAGNWIFTTLATGAGLGAEVVGAEQIIAGSITTDHIYVGSGTLTGKLEDIENNVAYRVDIFSTHGLIFRPDDISTTLIARVYKGSEDVTDTIAGQFFVWTRVSRDAAADTVWNNTHAGGDKQIVLTNEDVYQKATFFCNVTIS